VLSNLLRCKIGAQVVHKEFLKHYAREMQAVIRAGYSPKTAYSIGQENLKKPEIEKLIQADRNHKKQCRNWS